MRYVFWDYYGILKLFIIKSKFTYLAFQIPLFFSNGVKLFSHFEFEACEFGYFGLVEWHMNIVK